MLDVLSNNDVTFFIPPYQRNYEWTEEQCSVFWDDIKKTALLNDIGQKSEHFFGTITFFKTQTPFGQPDKLVLIDGQQRITTTMLFLIAMRDSIEDKNQKDFIDNSYLKNDRSTDDSEYKIKLKQVETDWIAYKKLVLREELVDKERASAVYRNYNFFLNTFKVWNEEFDDLMKLVELGLSQFSVVTIELNPQNAWENPQEIFESMNSLGKPLSLADLVRNYLLLGLDAEKQSELYNNYWLHIENVIPKQISNYIRNYMQMHEMKSFPIATDANSKKLYSFFKEIFENANSEELLKDLRAYADIYSYILPGGECPNKDIDKKLKDLQRINVTTAYSFILALLGYWKNGEFTDEEMTDILDVFFIYCLRRRILSLTQAENKSFPLLVRHIDRLLKADDKKAEMFNILAHQESNLRLPNDIEMSRHMETMNFYNFGYKKFCLALIEERITRSRPDLSDKHLQVEHIMPNELNDAWREYLGENHEEIHQEYANTIGNLTLIRHNQELGRKSFDQKKEVYENNAGLQIARTRITDCERWNEDAIKRRANWIIGYLLLKVLTIPEGMRKVNNFIVKEHSGLSFQELQLIGLDIHFATDPSITAKVVGDKQVEFEGKKWRLSPLTKEIFARKGISNASGVYRGARHWAYDGIKLSDIM